MLFSSLLFLCFFFPAVILLHRVLPAPPAQPLFAARQRFFLCVGRNPLCAADRGAGAEQLAAGARDGQIQRRLAGGSFVIVALCVDLGALCFYKYADFFLDDRGAAGAFPAASPLPLGISFFTFQAMGYLIDVYAGRIKAEKSLTDYATFMLLFPQLIAGPIVNYVDIKEQLKQRPLTGRGPRSGHGAVHPGAGAQGAAGQPAGNAVGARRRRGLCCALLARGVAVHHRVRPADLFRLRGLLADGHRHGTDAGV